MWHRTMASVKVAVRVRPLNKREKHLSSKVIIRVKDNTTSLLHTKLSGVQGDGLKDGAKSFSYDFSYDSTDENSPDFTSQEKIFQDLGKDVLHAAFQGFNACVFAYGQTGSGKSYTMMGHAGDKGLIPRICEDLFCEISTRNESDTRSFRTEVGYLEIYNERVLDLLSKKPSSAPKGGLRVREHPTEGPYVENLSRHVVHDYGDVKELMDTGNANRTTASTGMNDTSSRSHAMFTIHFTQAQFDSELPRETQSKIHLVDLAGSERANSTRATGARLKEGASINKSLVTLGTVISTLADLSDKRAQKKQTFVPYRDSVLTWLLKDSLGGNSKTIMIATVSPADVNYGETLSTLRYASRAKNIVNSPTVNEDASVRLIRELREEVARLRALLDGGCWEAPLLNSTASVVEERLQQSETKVVELTKEWTNKWWETENILKEEDLALRKEGSGVVLDSQLPHLIGIDKDLLSTGIIIYYLKEGRTLVGNDVASGPQDMAPVGERFLFENRDGAVSVIPGAAVDSRCLVDGVEVTGPCQLKQGAVIELGREAIFRFNHPAEAAWLRRERQNGQLSSQGLSLSDQSPSQTVLHPRSAPSTRTPAEDRRAEGPRGLETPDPHTVPGVPEASEVSEEAGALQLHTEPVGGRSATAATAAATVACGQGTPGPRRVDGAVGEGVAGAAQQTPASPPSDRRAALPEEGALGRRGASAAVSADPAPPSQMTPDPAAEKHRTEAMPGKRTVPPSTSAGAGLAPLGGAGAREGPEQQGAPSHKSGPGPVSAPPHPSGAGEAGPTAGRGGGGAARSGGVRLRQTSVPGPGDGCGTAPRGDANERPGVAADFCRGQRGPAGSSLGGAGRHLRRAGRGSAPPHAAAPSPPRTEDTPPRPVPLALEAPPGGAEEVSPEQGEPEAVAALEQRSRLGSLVGRVSWMFPDPGRLLQRLPGVPGVSGPQHRRWPGRVAALIRRSQVLNAVRSSQMFSLITQSYAFTLVRDSRAFSVVSGFPLMHRLQVELSQPETESGEMEHNTTDPDPGARSPPGQNSGVASPPDASSADGGSGSGHTRELQTVCTPSQEETWRADEVLASAAPPGGKSPAAVTTADEERPSAAAPSSIITAASLEDAVTVQITGGVRAICQTLLQFPDVFKELQSMSPPDLLASLLPLVPSLAFKRQADVSLYWLEAATPSQPRPRPTLLLLVEDGLYALTCAAAGAGALAVCAHLPWGRIQEVHVGLGGQSLRLTGGALPEEEKEEALSLHTHSRRLTQELGRALLGVLRPGDGRVSRHPVLHGELGSVSLDWHARVPDLPLGAGLRVTCGFQRSLAQLAYLLHANMAAGQPGVAEVRLLLYTGVRACTRPRARARPLARLLLTETHLGLVQEEPVFGAPAAPRRSHFLDLDLRRRADVRCLLLHEADGRASAEVDVVLAPGGVQPPEAPAQAEVWRLRFSCSAEAASLIGHLSAV